jgi:hypothetical protein
MVLYGELLKIYGDTPEYRDTIDNHIAGTISTLSRIDAKQKTNLIQTYIDKFADQNKILLKSLCRIHYADYRFEEKKNEERRAINEKFEHEKAAILHEKMILEEEKIAREKEIVAIINSRAYKSGTLIASPYRIISKFLKSEDKNE